ncbi:Glycine-rich rna-binding protein [Thalictrum thalictroides]|uniref:Glycine-rich rna-binding protein n=1 Tax=Thalictrum thalictroides TaxID=46969 RepID=A0A7J6WUW0_THATH|nr:Glycine-rich rna-binding protein [Thalictrum thalictroides]
MRLGTANWDIGCVKPRISYKQTNNLRKELQCTALSPADGSAPHLSATTFIISENRETGRSRGFGFVIFVVEKSMKDAIEIMNGQELNRRNITVNEAQSRSSGGARSDGGYSGGGGKG